MDGTSDKTNALQSTILLYYVIPKFTAFDNF